VAVSVTHAFVSGKSDGGDSTQVRPSDWNDEHVFTGLETLETWDHILTKASDQGVTNSTTLVDCTGLSFSCSSGEFWEVEVLLIYTADGTGDMQWRFNTPGFDLSVRVDWGENSANAAHSTAVREASTTTTTARAAGGGTTTVLRGAGTKGFIATNASGTIQVQFAQLAATAGQTATIKAGSYLRARQLV